jgi:hypothetical protein
VRGLRVETEGHGWRVCDEEDQLVGVLDAEPTASLVAFFGLQPRAEV